MYHLPRARQHATRNSGLLAAMLLLIVVFAARCRAAAQSSSSSSVTGRVVNAVSGASIPRVLVQLGSAVAFTDHDGKFVLGDGLTGGGMVMLTKPGYFTSPERTDPPGIQVTTAQLAQPLELRLYPEALLTGTVASQDGAPLPAVRVTARRLASDEAARHFETIASAETDLHGGFRLAVPAGDYQVSTQFVATSAETGLSLLPALTPTGSGGSTFHISSGEQQQLELRPHTGIPHTVGLSIGGLSEDRSPTVSVSTANGATWQMGAGSEAGSDETVIRLPAGSYHLNITSTTGDNNLSFGETRLTVPDHDIAGIAVQLATVAPISVEISVDPHASTTSPPSPQELGLQLIPEQDRDLGREDIVRLGTRRGGSPMMLPHPGHFRLVAAPRSSWYIESATYGGAEVLGQALAVNPGSGSPPLQLVVNNVMGSLDGRVTDGGAPTDAWIALLPTFPCATPIITLRAASDGSFSRPSLQPGTYLALALEHRTSVNLQDAAVRSSLGLRTQAVTIGPGAKTTLDLEVVGGGSSAP